MDDPLANIGRNVKEALRQMDIYILACEKALTLMTANGMQHLEFSMHQRLRAAKVLREKLVKAAEEVTSTAINIEP